MHLKDLLLIDSMSISELAGEYRLLALGLIPFVFILAIIFEHFLDQDIVGLVKRVVISICILTSVSFFYESSIKMSIDDAHERLASGRYSNIYTKDIMQAAGELRKAAEESGERVSKEENYFTGSMSWLKQNIIGESVNAILSVILFLISHMCFFFLKLSFSLVYYLGLGLCGIPCLLYVLPKMGKVLMGAITSYLWCLIVPHVLVFVIVLISTEVEKGFKNGEIIGSTVTGTAFVLMFVIMIAGIPLIASMILSGAGVMSAASTVATIGMGKAMQAPTNLTNTVVQGASTVGGLMMGSAKSLMSAGSIKGKRS